MVKVWHKLHGKDYKEAFFPETRVKHKDYFHIKDFYKMMHDYMVEHEFCERIYDPFFPEIWYSHQWDQVNGEEIHFWWRFTKALRGNEYLHWNIDVDVNIFGVKHVEIMKDGVKHKVQFGEPEIKIFGRILVDPEGKWKKHWFLRTVHELFWKRIYWKQFLSQRKDLLKEIYRFEEHIKTYFKLATYLPEPEGEGYYPTDEME